MGRVEVLEATRTAPNSRGQSKRRSIKSRKNQGGSILPCIDR